MHCFESVAAGNIWLINFVK